MNSELSKAELVKKAKARLEQIKLEKQLQNLDEQDDETILARKAEADKKELVERAKARLEQLRQAPEEKAPDSVGDDVLDVLGELASGANRSAIGALDLVTSPIRGISNLGATIAGAEGRMPSFTQLLEQTPGGKGGFMDEGLARDAVSAAGMALPVGASFMPVQRAAGATSSVVQDILGLGSSTLSQNQRMAELTATVIQDMDALRLGKEVLETKDDIYEAAYRLGKKQILERNRPLLREAEELEAERLKQIEKSGVSDIEPPKSSTKVSLSQLTDEMYAIYGVTPTEVLKAIAKKGLRYDDDLLSMQEADKFLKGLGKDKDINWYDYTFLPVADKLKRYVSPRVGGLFERATDTATRKTSVMVDELGKPVEKVLRLLDDNIELKRLFLDVGKYPAKIKDIQNVIRSELDEKSVEAFNRFIRISGAKNGEALKKLFVRDGGFDDIIYVHTQKKPDKSVRKPKPTSKRRLPGEKPDALRVRTRKDAAEMTDEEVAMYENPLATHLQYLAEQEYLLELATKFGMRPSLAKNSNILDFFKELEAKLKRDGLSDFEARQARNIIYDAYEGSRTSPNAATRAFMDLSYAGSIAQLKTATLNLHDVAVAMFNQGLIPTLKAVVQTNKGMFGKTLSKLGIGDSQSVGEFSQNYDIFRADPSLADKAAKATKSFSSGSMFISGFKYLDRVGKGVVLRATLNRARTSAKKGTLFKDFGHLMREDELIKIRKYLKEGTPPDEVPEDVAELIEEIAFSGLAEQQLTSIAGRPLGYINHPNLRFLYALSGFAIKQQALLRTRVIDEIVKGNYAEAGKNAASYALYAGIGYGIIQEGREAIAGKEEFDSGEIMVNAVDQIVAAATLNRLGDDYGRTKFLQDPVQFLMESFLPPTGLVGASLQDVVGLTDSLITGEDFDSKFAEKFPLIGDFYKYYWKDK